MLSSLSLFPPFTLPFSHFLIHAIRYSVSSPSFSLTVSSSIRMGLPLHPTPSCSLFFFYYSEYFSFFSVSLSLCLSLSLATHQGRVWASAEGLDRASLLVLPLQRLLFLLRLKRLNFEAWSSFTSSSPIIITSIFHFSFPQNTT